MQVFDKRLSLHKTGFFGEDHPSFTWLSKDKMRMFNEVWCYLDLYARKKDYDWFKELVT